MTGGLQRRYDTHTSPYNAYLTIPQLQSPSIASQIVIEVLWGTHVVPPLGGLTVLQSCDIHNDIGTTLYFLQCLHVSCCVLDENMLSYTTRRLHYWLISYAKAMKLSYYHNSWGEPERAHIDHDNGPARGIMVSIYLSFYHLPRVCHTLVSEICVHPEMLHVFRYIDVLTCVIYNWHSTELNSKDNWMSYSSWLMSAVKIIDEDR